MPYCGPAPAPGELLAQWNLDPVVLGPLLLGLAVLAVMARRLPAPTVRAKLRRSIFCSSLMGFPFMVQAAPSACQGGATYLSG